MQFPSCYRSPNLYGKHPVDQWIDEYIIEQDDTVRMKQHEEYVWVPCDMRIPPHVNGKIHEIIVQPPMLYEMETVSMASSHMKKLECIGTDMCR